LGRSKIDYRLEHGKQLTVIESFSQSNWPCRVLDQGPRRTTRCPVCASEFQKCDSLACQQGQSLDLVCRKPPGSTVDDVARPRELVHSK
jgi:hypothetical protein